MSYPQLNPCPFDCFENLAMLMVFWVSFLQVVQAMKGTCVDLQMAAGARAPLAMSAANKVVFIVVLPITTHLTTPSVEFMFECCQ